VLCFHVTASCPGTSPSKELSRSRKFPIRGTFVIVKGGVVLPWNGALTQSRRFGRSAIW
jgi:hypothetical protein